jgi:hypothetical protein
MIFESTIFKAIEKTCYAISFLLSTLCMISMVYSVEWNYVIETTDCFYIYDKVHDETLVDARCLESRYFIKLLHLGIEHECGK